MWNEIFPDISKKLYLSIILASPNMNFWAALVSCWREAGQGTICHTEDSRTSHSFTGRMARLYPWSRPLSFLLLSHLVMSTFCEPMNYGMPGHPVPRYLPEFAQVHVHCIGDAIQASHPLTPSSPSALSLSQNQGLLQWVICYHQMTIMHAYNNKKS